MKTVETLLRAHWREQTLLVAVKGLAMYCTYEQYTDKTETHKNIELFYSNRCL